MSDGARRPHGSDVAERGPSDAGRPGSPVGAILALLAALFGAVAAIGGAMLLGDPGRVVVHPEAFVSPTGLIDAHNSPAVLRDPTDPDGLVVVNRVDRPRFSAVLHWSRDGGRVWRSTALPLPDGLDRAYAPDAAFAPDGTLFVSYVNLEGAGNVPANLWLARSDNGGQTLSQPLRVAGELAFQARIAIGPDGVVHLTYLEAEQVGTLSLTGPARVVAVRSEDGGSTFSPPVAVSDPDRERVGAAAPVVLPDGTVVVLYQDFKGDVRDFQNLEGPPWPEPFALVVSRSEDAGRTFSAGVEIESGVVPAERFLVFLPPFPSISAGADGSLAVAWSDARNGDRDVFVRRSRDGGRSWGDAVRVNDNRFSDGTDQYLPAVAVAETGRVDVVFLDRRRDPQNVMTDTYLATSPDGGSPFHNVRLSSVSSDPRVGPRAAAHLPVDAGSRLGLVSDGDRSVAAWTDTRLGSEATGRQDIVAAVVEHPDRRARAVVRGLVVAALTAAVGALAARRWVRAR